MEQSHFNDDLLRLIFTCCHPGLNIEAQLALTLRTVLGFRLEEVARAFVVNERTMEQRLVRAKRKIKNAGIPYEVPDTNQLSERLSAVLWVVYLIFNEGYTATEATSLIRQDLCDESIRLARLLHRLFRGNAEVIGLLALLILQNARRFARVTPDGLLVPLEKQDRSLWIQGEISEGSVLVENALRSRQPGPYQIQAAIAAIHNQAASPKETDWAQISLLYIDLKKFLPTPIVHVNKAVVISMVKGADFGIRLLLELEGVPELQRYHLYYAALAELFLRVNQPQKAIEHFKTASNLTKNPTEFAYLQNRIDQLQETSTD